MSIAKSWIGLLLLNCQFPLVHSMCKGQSQTCPKAAPKIVFAALGRTEQVLFATLIHLKL